MPISSVPRSDLPPSGAARQPLAAAGPDGLPDGSPDRGAVLTKAVLAAADRLGLSGRVLAQVLGLSQAQVSRLRSGEATLSDRSKTFELAALLVRAFRSLDAITGGDEAVARAWMSAPNLALAAQRPVDCIATVRGLTDVAAYLDARRAPL